MFEKDRRRFWEIYTSEDGRRKINVRRLSKKIGFSASTLYKFQKQSAGSPDLLDAISLEIFGRSWIDMVAKQDAEQNDRQKADDKKGDGGMNIGDLYERLGEIRNEMKSQFEALNHKIDSHISSITAHHSPARDKKFLG